MGRFAMSLDYRFRLVSGLAIRWWGGWGLFGKLALAKKMAPTSLVLAAVGISAACAAPVWWLLVRQPAAAALAPAWNVVGLAAGAGVALGLWCYDVALEASHASIVVPLSAVYPAVSVLLSYALLDERPTGAQGVGIVCVIVGAILLLAGPTANLSHA